VPTELFVGAVEGLAEFGQHKTKGNLISSSQNA
jgi:hypothetical protein